MSTTLEQIQYGFDRDSRRTWQRRALNTLQDQAYQYDSLSQVSAATRGSLNLNLTAISGVPAAVESWDYDPTGNWRGYHTAAAGTTTLDQHRVHDRGNRLTQIEDNPHNMILDRVGHMRQAAPDASGDWDGKLEITWDAWSRITSVKNNGEVIGEYAYDGNHRRVTREVDSETLHSYYNEAWRPVEERKDAETTAAISYLWGARHRDDLVRRDRALVGTTLNETRYVLMDYFSPAAITDEQGEVTERYQFSAFGLRTILNPDFTVRSDSECAMEFSFQGQFEDGETGWMNYGYRYYLPALGRWACKDFIEENGGFNLYCMVSNTPINSVDKFGLSETVECEWKYIIGHDIPTGLDELKKWRDEQTKGKHPNSNCGDSKIGFGTCAPEYFGSVVPQESILPAGGRDLGLYTDNDWLKLIEEARKRNLPEPKKRTKYRRNNIEDFNKAIDKLFELAGKQCDNKKNCCKAISVEIRCSAEFQKLYSDAKSLGFKNPCTRSRVVKC